MTRILSRAALAASLAASLLAGCGGDDGTPAASNGQVPASAAASEASLEAFAISLAPSETAEPLALDRVSTLPTSETQEPVAVN